MNDLNQASMFKSEVPKMPDGYYSGDKPNPNLRAFVEQHLKDKPYNPETDNYDVPAFDKPIETTKATAIYNMHTYWSKKPHDVMQQYIKHYTQPGDLVLDPFCGSGGTALAALMEGRKAIATDRSPAATFIAKNYCTPVDIKELMVAFDSIRSKVAQEIDWLYETRCDRCGGKAKTAYTVFSQVVQCGRCLEKIPLFSCVEVEGKTVKGKPKKIRACPHCYAKGIIEEISSREERLGAIPVLVSYVCDSGCRPKRCKRHYNDIDEVKKDYFIKYDLGKLSEIEQRDIPYWYPRNSMMNMPEEQACWGILWRRGYHRNIHSVSDFYTKRNLWALALILESIRSVEDFQDVLLFIFTSILFKSSKMMAHNSDGIGRIQKGTYYIPQIEHDIHVWQFMEEALGDMISGYQAIDGLRPDLMISTSDVRMLDIPSNSIDYIFTDPPYADKVQYGELNYMWEAWLSLDTSWQADEIIVNTLRSRSEIDWAGMMREAISECFRVLKPGRSLSLCYHDTSEGTWTLIQDVMAEAGFVVEKTEGALYIEAKTKTMNQYFGDKVTKRDLVINFRKPKPGEAAPSLSITGNETTATFNEKVRLVISSYLITAPGSTKDHIYDEVVSHMVRAGEMEAHNFDELLSQIAEEIREPLPKNLFESEGANLFGTHEIGRWYLKETDIAVIDAAESEKEDIAASQIAEFIGKELSNNSVLEGVHYSDLFEFYVYAVKDKPRRPLAEWLLDYFYKTETGTYRLSASEEEKQLKAQGRAKGINRRIKRYVAYLEQGVLIPEKEQPNDATLVEWIRHCKRAGLFEQGKLLFERGGLNLDNLSEEDMINAEEDYRTCMRNLARAAQM